MLEKKLISHNDKDGFGRERSRKTQAFVAVRSQVNNTHTEEVGRDRTNIPTELPQSDSFQGQQKTWETSAEAREGIHVAVQENWVFTDTLSAVMSKSTVCKIIEYEPFVCLCTHKYVNILNWKTYAKYISNCVEEVTH